MKSDGWEKTINGIYLDHDSDYLLLEYDDYVKIYDKRKKSMLIQSCMRGFCNIVEYAIRYGLDYKSDTFSVFHNAAYYGHLDIVKLLLNNGVDIDDYWVQVSSIVSRSRNHGEVADYIENYVIIERSKKINYLKEKINDNSNN